MEKKTESTHTSSKEKDRKMIVMFEKQEIVTPFYFNEIKIYEV